MAGDTEDACEYVYRLISLTPKVKSSNKDFTS